MAMSSSPQSVKAAIRWDWFWSDPSEPLGFPDGSNPGFSGIRAPWIDPSNGRQIDEFELMHEMATRQVVLLGETHTIAEIHRWQLHVATILRFIRRNIAVGFEMFPRRVQPVLDEWVAGELTSLQFLEKVDWENKSGATMRSSICRFFIFAGSSGYPCWRSIATGRW